MHDIALWTPYEISQATGGRWLIAPPADWAPRRVSYDVSGNMKDHICVLVHPSSWGRSRADASGAIPRLARQGAAAILVQKDHLLSVRASLGRLPASLPVCLVENTWTALRDMAHIARMRHGGKVFAVTGTVGKTTTREMIRHMAAGQGGATASAANNNNISGVHRTLASAGRSDAACVVEMGFGKPLDGVERSSRIAQPDVALLMTLDVAHFDMFSPEMLAKADGLELLLRCKSGIFSGLAPGGAAVINGDLPNFPLARALAARRTQRIHTFGTELHHDACPLAIESDISATRARVRVLGRTFDLLLKVPGRHMVMNALGALLALGVAGFDLDKAVSDLAEFTPVGGRARVFEADVGDGRRVTVVDDSFNATLASVRSCLDLLALARPRPGGRRIAVLGEIGHVGAREEAEHRALSEAVVRSGADTVFSWGPLMRALHDALPASLRGAHEDVSVEDLYAHVFSALQDGDVVVVKSGRGQNGLGDIRFRKFVSHLREGRPALEL
ncbi:Mur ligase family protein [Celeribacter indicus]|uniref:UDP-N-acetylmuramoyl-tripeptide--D-alanyl-D-alanine ligase n=1 Tax=Celeribacter indicus TaxID=1208324 RepID=A0A0B5E957_9RHOB|nr:Mur ligase family protein [Celeribacter indicus]AJE48857.1 UDP-N-acetylmuramoyl-tripeptide--D-alanyl-D-alanine ligase [Celeribacter indicus]SDW39313.1 UDP-N-acetylmuramoyl-tripeptide--D-alanyl-D-alanine ligase [Celeribacter indicus]